MARDLGDVLGPSLNAGPVPESGRDLVRYAGGRRALVEQLSGMAGPPKRADYASTETYEAARTRWRSASRRVQRWSTEGRQQRLTPRLTATDKGRVRRQANREKRRQLARRGMRARLRATVRVETPTGRGAGDTRTRTMPSGGPAVLIPPSVVEDILAAAQADDREAAAEDFLEAFWAVYGMPSSAEVEEVQWLRVWPDGEAEPR